jgi:holo-[acyl-carrier protein] synthase
MIVGIGIDLVEVERITKALTRHGPRFERRVFTPKELEDCTDRVDRDQALAARFAAKEACLKALRTGWAEGLFFRQVEVTRAANGAPGLRLYEEAAKRAAAMGVRSVHVSLTHQPGIAGAIVLLEGDVSQSCPPNRGLGDVPS